MALQDNINAQLAQNRGKTVAQRDDIGFRYMAGNAVDGLMERNHFPGYIRVGLDGFFQKCLVFSNAQATGVQHHIQGVVVSKVVVTVTGRLRIHSVIAIGIAADLTVLFADVGQGKMLSVQGGVVAAVMVAQLGCQRQLGQLRGVQEAVILFFHLAQVAGVVLIIGVDLVTHAEQEVCIGGFGQGVVQGVGPAAVVIVNAATAADLRVAEYQEGVWLIFSKGLGGVGFGFAVMGFVLIGADSVFIGGVALQAGQGNGILVPAFAAGRGHGSLQCGHLTALYAVFQHAAGGGAAVPCHVHGILGSTDVHHNSFHIMAVGVKSRGIDRHGFRRGSGFGGGFLGQRRGNGHAHAHDQRKGTGSQTIPVLQVHFSSHTLSIHPNQILAGVSAMPAPGF